MDRQGLLSRSAAIGAIFTGVVICLGALTRLVNAGLGCPDWPGCYGKLIVPASQKVAELIYPATPLVAYKAWAEMVHRYFAGTLSVICLLVVGLLLMQYRTNSRHPALDAGSPEKTSILASRLTQAILLIALIIYQIMLGRWTVTLHLLPVIVTQHLMGGLLIMSLLWFIHISQTEKHHLSTPYFKPLARIAFILVLAQIFLGAWTSTHYASLSCPDFPFCENAHPLLGFSHVHLAFPFSSTTGINYEGGVLALPIRQSIQMLHRLGALIVTGYLLGFGIFTVLHVQQAKVQRWAIAMMLCCVLQISLGMANVLFALPLPIAMAHTVTAAFLLLTVVTLNGITKT
ncbi:MAG: cytochrome b561 [marine bacterium B5-7]|nr:MAG: cytochrome b561 [marine bacterium B5-7]